MAFSVNTNVGAMTALQSLNATSKSLSTTQSRINTGLNVASTKDDSATYSIAQKLRGNLSDMKAVSQSLQRAKSVIDVAVNGAEQITDYVNQMRTLAKQASDSGVGASSLAAYNNDFIALRDQIVTVINSSEFNGTNLLKTGAGSVSALQSLTNMKTLATDAYIPDTLNVANQELTLANPEVPSTGADTGQLGIDSQINTPAKAMKMVDTLDFLTKNLSSKVATLGSASRAINAQLTFASKLSDTFESGVGNLVDADLAKESAKLTALQTKQQLGVQALSIANQAPQMIGQLFKG
ncbi:flagellin [Sphingomonas sp. SORGH_AS802]|uniref:flagellin n=1 Tax=unclassified Sphingomonas TaxID=196159 RepID=UPI00285E450E|nr:MULTISPECIES: flagellin [unclassified Sphingomonas]MDR6125362.1 flagellin [Sphingomonas sp. SORGH_AS_0438]MDR6133980.1 flagellin [Sphingomonas sp. SORGH_AS_0802]